MIDTLRSVLRFRRFELDATTRRLARTTNIDDLRAIARRRLPRGVFDYIDGGADDERTLAANRDAFARGVDHVLGLLDADVRRVMALVGATRVSGLNRDLVE